MISANTQKDRRGKCKTILGPAIHALHVLWLVKMMIGSVTCGEDERTGFHSECENWDGYDFKALLRLVKSFVLLIWDTRKNMLYGDQYGKTSGCSCSCPLTGDLTSSTCIP